MRVERKRKKMKKKKKSENSGASTWTFIADTHAASQISRWEKEKKKGTSSTRSKGREKKKKKGQTRQAWHQHGRQGLPPSFFFLFFSLLAIKREQVCESTVIAIILEKEERKKERNLIDFIFSIIWLLTWQARVEPRQGGHDVMKIWHCHRVHVGRFSLGGRHLRSWAWLKSGENDEFNYYNQNSIDLNTWYFQAQPVWLAGSSLLLKLPVIVRIPMLDSTSSSARSFFSSQAVLACLRNSHPGPAGE